MPSCALLLVQSSSSMSTLSLPMISCLSVSGCHPLPHSSFSLLLQCPPCLLLIIFLVPFPLLAPIFSRTELRGCRVLCDIRLNFSGPAKQEIARDSISVCGRQRKASITAWRGTSESLSPSRSACRYCFSATFILLSGLCPCLSLLFHMLFHSCMILTRPAMLSLAPI